MRLLAALPHYPPTSRVGAWLATHQLLAHLAARGHTVTVTTTLGQPGAYDLDGVHVVPHARARALMPLHDAVLCHLGGELRIGEQTRRHGLPLVVSAHGQDRFNLYRLQRLAPDHLIVNSRALQASIGWDGPTTVLHPTVRPERFAGPRGRNVTLVNVTERKGSGTFYALAQRYPQRAFLGVRGGYGQPDERDLPNVELLGTQGDMRAVYARTRVLLMPSESETYGMAALEAMASGIPVIAHPTPGLVESLDGAGLLVDRDDVDAWAAALDALDDPAVYASWSRAALGRVARLTPDDDLDRVADLLEDLVEGARRGAVV